MPSGATGSKGLWLPDMGFLHQRRPRHGFGLGDAPHAQQGRGHIGQFAVMQAPFLAGSIQQDAGHGIGGVGGLGLALPVLHDFAVAVVGDEQHPALTGLHGSNHAAHAFIHHRAGFHGGGKHARMAHHVAVGQVADHQIVLAALPGFHELVRDLAGAHGRLLVIGLHLARRRHEDAVFQRQGPGGDELRLARETIVVAARAAGIDALDTVYSNLNDMETFRQEVEYIKTLGFDGKSIINPRQIEVINEVFAPKEKEITKARAIIAAIKEAEAKGSGVIALNGKMIDRPVVIRAQRTINLAIASGILKEEDL